ncbi:hypothetical protein CVT24_001498 [Panaeolus cyanescens]|uniref:Uncharacterized protein n=1 Tax=Panaeolus cyanescens TaxID=181874 RepID=A0A409YF70_9AGAR|nr:hypothetical protein CVT24_001498 [Panaeolus cyanescens]
MSTSKTLSNGTLSLRFMQRAKETKEVVQLDKAEVKDDGEWEVSREIREAWGLVGNARDGESSNGMDKIHEESYVPFLFGNDVDEGDDDEGWGSRAKTKGRRVFNNKGEDVSFKTTTPQPVVSSTSNANITSLSNSTPSSNTTTTKPLKTFERPSSISTVAKGHGKKKQSARDAIFGNDNVGVDLRAQKKEEAVDDQTPAAPTPVLSTGFMKPAGVDEPKKPSTVVKDEVMDTGVINGARAPVKRRVDDDGDLEKGDKKKKRRKKKNAPIET